MNASKQIQIRAAQIGQTDKRADNAMVLALALGMICAIAPELAFAAVGESTLQTIVGWLTGSMARSAAIIGFALCGYMAFVGQMSWKIAGNVILGIVLVFGGASLVDMFAGSVG